MKAMKLHGMVRAMISAIDIVIVPSDLVNINGNQKSLQMGIKLKIATVAGAGRISGIIIFKNSLGSLQPSTLAELLNSSGIILMKSVRTKTPIGIPSAMYTRINANKLSYKFNFTISCNIFMVPKRIPLATAQLFGQWETDFGLIFAILSLASIPVIVFYLISSKHFQKGIFSGSIKE